MVKKIIIGILAAAGGILLVFGMIVGFFLVSDFKQEDKLEAEIEGFPEDKRIYPPYEKRIPGM